MIRSREKMEGGCLILAQLGVNGSNSYLKVFEGNVVFSLEYTLAKNHMKSAAFNFYDHHFSS